ncbi:PREDICTED: denticleless protein homolog isoform X1 [Nelumbo nucifera]|uniref:Denticleless protein homolog isoform X1 n=1 Tax=Nelumbo nucifera TaxID=4432 RepID=A0A1U7ZBP8_NELNU|nr:PREDICTED: denticleless protein homolog isoform X1 [Nelumbo nucifera]
MASSNSPSFFQDLKMRELNGFRVRKRPHLGDLASDPGSFGSGVLSIEHNGVVNPPMAASFCKSSKNYHLLAVSDEDGYVSIYDTHRKLPSLTSCRENADEARVCDWVAHSNAIFDVRWVKDDSLIMTASGDQSIKIWDVEKRSCVNVLTGHTGSVKSLCSHPSNLDLLVSGSRDGCFALWDLRCKPNSKCRRLEPSLSPIHMVKGAHVSAQGKRVRRGKAASMSITSVLYLKDEISIASAGAVDSVLKFWDTRNFKAPITQAQPHPEPSTEKERRLHGISSLTQDSNGLFLSASCMDNRIYLYNVLQLDKGPVQTFFGSRIESFYVKAAISPDATHILSGSSDGNAYIWQVKNPQARPIILNGHEGEITAVDCTSFDCRSPDVGKIVTSSDDFTVRVWNIQQAYYSSTRSPTSIRRRVTAIPSMECRNLFKEESPMCSTKTVRGPSEEALIGNTSHDQISMPEISTPESLKKKFSSSSFSNEEPEMEKTPEAALKSPSSVLNPPSSLKRRTIRDYFVAAS